MFDNLLLPSIQKQSFKDYEIIKIDTTKISFKSAAETLNYGVLQSKGDILVFCHQDIELLDIDALEKIDTFSREYSFGVAGVAGVNLGNKQVYSSVIQGKNKEVSGELINNLKEIDVLDECLFFIKRDNFKEFKDYDSWHFYAVERCLYYKKQGYQNYILPVNIYHVSPGYSLNKSYWDTLLKIASDYQELKYITTTIGNFKNNKFLKIKVFFLRIKKRIAKIVKRK